MRNRTMVGKKLFKLLCVASMGLMVMYVQPALAVCTGVSCSCSVSADPVSFGNYSPITPGNHDITGNVEVTCSVTSAGITASYVIKLDTGSGGNFSPRQMASGSDTLDYNLYTDGARSNIWGDGTLSTFTVNDSYDRPLSTQEIRNYTVYARISQQNVPVGTYSDTITVTVEY